MIKRSWLGHLMRGYLPAHANRTLSPLRKWILELWLARDVNLRNELSHMQSFRLALRSQPQLDPNPSGYQNIKALTQTANVREQSSWQSTFVWPAVVTLLVLAAIFLWRALPPGLEISWTLEGRTPTSFRIYRAPIDSTDGENFSLIGELPARNGVSSYGYTDLRLVPGQQFLYQVEAIDVAGQAVRSQALTGNSLEALPRQLMFLFVFLIISLGLFGMLRQIRSVSWRLEQLGL